jgi:hypothetical protein
MMGNSEVAGTVSCCSGESVEGGVISHCPMAAQFKSTFGSPKLKLSLYGFGAVLIVLGIAIIMEPRIVAWLIAMVTILMGMALLMMGHFINRMTSSLMS